MPSMFANSSLASPRRRGVNIWRLGRGLEEARPSLSPALNSLYDASRVGAVDFLKDATIHRGNGLDWRRMLEWEDSLGRTPLLIAVEMGQLKSAEFLLETGADVHHISRQINGGKSPLHAAFELANPRQMVQLLLAYGADPFLENNAGYTAFDICLKNKRKESEEIAKESTFTGSFQVRDGNCLTSHRPLKGMELKLFACYRLNQNGTGEKELSALRMLVFKRRIQNLVYDIDLLDCDIRLISKTANTYGVHISCPVHCIEEWNGSSMWGSVDCTFSDLYIQGDEKTSEQFLEIVKQCQSYEALRNEAEDHLEEQQQQQPTMEHHETNNEQSDQQQEDKSHHNQSMEPQQRNKEEESSSTEALSSKCVICLENERTVGFVHGESMHVCVCQDCAQHFSRVVDRCPLCRQSIHHIVHQIYWS